MWTPGKKFSDVLKRAGDLSIIFCVPLKIASIYLAPDITPFQPWWLCLSANKMALGLDWVTHSTPPLLLPAAMWFHGSGISLQEERRSYFWYAKEHIRRAEWWMVLVRGDALVEAFGARIRRGWWWAVRVRGDAPFEDWGLVRGYSVKNLPQETYDGIGLTFLSCTVCMSKWCKEASNRRSWDAGKTWRLSIAKEESTDVKKVKMAVYGINQKAKIEWRRMKYRR